MLVVGGGGGSDRRQALAACVTAAALRRFLPHSFLPPISLTNRTLLGRLKQLKHSDEIILRAATSRQPYLGFQQVGKQPGVR